MVGNGSESEHTSLWDCKQTPDPYQGLFNNYLLTETLFLVKKSFGYFLLKGIFYMLCDIHTNINMLSENKCVVF
jgi:hypothetical protein